MNRATVDTEEKADTVKLPGLIEFIKGITTKPISKKVIDVEPLVEEEKVDNLVKANQAVQNNNSETKKLEIKDSNQSSVDSEILKTDDPYKLKQNEPITDPFKEQDHSNLIENLEKLDSIKSVRTIRIEQD